MQVVFAVKGAFVEDLKPMLAASKGGGQKKSLQRGSIMWISLSGPWVSLSGLWVAGPHNFPCHMGWVPLPFQQVLGSPFSPKSYSF